MRSWLTEVLRCPQDGGPLSLEVLERSGEEIIDGLLACQTCASIFCVDGGIPRFVGPEFYDDRDFRARHGQASGRLTANSSPHSTAKRTSSSFGFEWHEYARFGWEGEAFGPAYTRGVFEQQLFFHPGDLGGKLVLDAGCGNGRYTHMASEFGAREVIGCDISAAVEVAYRNLSGTENGHIVQADVFNLPFRPQTFDVVFSIGVLHHTGDTERAFRQLVKLLKPGGTLSVDIYRRQVWLNEILDALLRSVTTRMDRERLLRVSRRVSPILMSLDRLKLHRHMSLLRLLNFFARLEPHHHMLFDWYSAPHADRHTPRELSRWFSKNGLEVVDSSWAKRSLSTIQRLRRRLLPDIGMGARGTLTGVDEGDS